MKRVTVGVGSVVTLTFNKPVIRMVPLAGAQMKAEMVTSFHGTISEVKDTKTFTPEGKPDYEFTIRNSNSFTITTKRSNIAECVLHSDV